MAVFSKVGNIYLAFVAVFFIKGDIKVVDIERTNTELIICIGEDEECSKLLSDMIMRGADASNGRNIKLALLELLLQTRILPRKYTLKGIEIRDMRRGDDVEDSWIEVRCVPLSVDCQRKTC